MRHAKPATALITAIALSGCLSLAPSYERPPVELPESWAGASGRDASTFGMQWWKIFGDPALERLIEEAFAHNTDLQVAVARVDEARALLGQSRADQIPDLDAQASRSRTQVAADQVLPGAPREADSYQALLRASYEIDLWGRLYNASKAARANLLATEAAQRTVRIALAAGVVQAYYTLRALDEQVAATQRSIESREQSLALQKIRADSGVISEFEYRQLEAEVLAARAQLPSLLAARARQESALAVLLGRSPRAIMEGTDIGAVDEAVDNNDALDVLVVPGGLPSQLLMRRPDLIEAEQQLIAANANIGVARAAFFPSISLTAYVGGQSAALDDLFDEPSEVSQVAGSFTLPIFGMLRAKALTDAANARQRQALARYQGAIQNAFREVRDAIIAQERAREQFEAEDRRVNALRETLRLARLRYENGVASQLDVLDAERNLLAADLSRSEARRLQRVAIADLFRALGGGWKDEP